MKTFRLFAAALFLSAFGLVAPAQDNGEIALLRSKAEKGNGIAQYNLGLAYFEGHGVAADPIEAYVWLSLARENGARGRALDALVATFDKATFEAAQHRLAERKGTPPNKKPAATVAPAQPVPAGPPAAVSTETTSKSGATTDTSAKPAVDSARLADQIAALAADKRQLSNEAAQALKEIEGLKAELAEAKSQTSPEFMRLRQERDSFSTRLNDLATEAAALRTDRDRLQAAAAQAEKEARNAGDTARAAQESARASETRIGELVRNLETATAELNRTKQSLAALGQAPRLAADSAGLEQKTRELQAATSELEASRAFGRKVEDTLNKVTDEKTRELQAAATELEASRKFGREVEDTLNKVTDEKVAIERKLAALQTAATDSGNQAEALKAATSQLASTQAELAKVKADLTEQSQKTGGQIESLNAQLAVASKRAETGEADRDRLQKELAGVTGKLATVVAAPAYPDLSGRVKELEAQLADAREATGSTAKAADAVKAQLAERDAQLQTAQGDVQLLGQKLKQADIAMNQAQESYRALQTETEKLRAQPAAPAYPDLSGKVADLESKLAATEKLAAEKPATPAYPDLSAKVSELEGQVTALQDSAAAAGKELAALAKAKETAEHEVASANETQSGLRTTVAKLEQEKEQLAAAAKPVEDAKRRIAGLGEKAATAEKQAASLRQERDALSTKLTGLTGEVAQLREDRERMQKLLSDSGKQLRGTAASASRIKELEAQVASDATAAAAAKTEANQTQEQIVALTKAKEAAEAQVGGVTAERDAARTAQAELHVAVDKLEQEKNQLAAAQAAAPAFPDLSGRVRELEAQVAAASQHADAVAQGALAASNQSTADLNAANEQITRLKTAVAERPSAPAYPDLSGKVGELQAAVATATARVAELTTTAEEHAKHATDLETELKQAQAALAAKSAAPAYPDLSGRVHELETAAADAARQLTAADTAQAELKRQLTEASANLQNASKTKGTDDTQLRRERDDLSARVTGLTGEVAQLRTDRERMQKLLADSGKQLRDSTADASRIKELEGQLASGTAAMDATKTEASQAREQIAALTKAKDDAQAQIDSLQTSLAAKNAAPAYPDLSGKVSEIEAQLNQAQTALAAKPAAPNYPDLSGRVSELEAQLAAAPKRSNAPVYPNLAGRVVELETALADAKRQLSDAETALHTAEQSKPAPATAPEAAPSDLQKQLADTEDKLATSLRGYSLLEKERDEQVAKAGQAAEAVTAERNALATQVASLTTEVEQLKAGAQSSNGTAQAEISRLNESLTALQRSTAQNTNDLAAARALLQQLQGANAVLAGENYQLKTMLARSAGAPSPVKAVPVSAPPGAPSVRTHVVAAGDSLSRLSQRYYGAANRWQEIYNANRDKIGADGLLRIGTELRIP